MNILYISSKYHVCFKSVLENVNRYVKIHSLMITLKIFHVWNFELPKVLPADIILLWKKPVYKISTKSRHGNSSLEVSPTFHQLEACLFSFFRRGRREIRKLQLRKESSTVFKLATQLIELIRRKSCSSECKFPRNASRDRERFPRKCATYGAN